MPNEVPKQDAALVRRRLPSTEKSIIDIQPESDVRIRIMGTVIGTGQNTIVVDDGTGKVEIIFDDRPSYINTGQRIRVVTRILPLIDGFECRGECVQQLDGFDTAMYKKARETIKAK